MQSLPNRRVSAHTKNKRKKDKSYKGLTVEDSLKDFIIGRQPSIGAIMQKNMVRRSTHIIGDDRKEIFNTSARKINKKELDPIYRSTDFSG